MDTPERVWDASPLIGVVLIVPALFYLSFWWQFTGRFLQHAQRATAQVVSLERHVGQYRHNGFTRTHVYYYTWVHFTNAQGQATDGLVAASRPWARPGAAVEIYYAPDHPDVRFAGLAGVWAGLAIVVGVCLLGLLASFIAWRLTCNRRDLSAADEFPGELGDI